MKKYVPLVFLAVLFIMPMVNAEPSISIGLSPEPEFNQIWAYETYRTNVTIQGLNITEIDTTEFIGDPVGVLVKVYINWRGKGGYDFGTATTGYNYNLDETNLNTSISFDETKAILNITLERDAFEYGMKPFETVEVVFDFDAYLLMEEEVGPLFASNRNKYTLIDDTKTSYLEGKYLEMQNEINPALNARGLESLNRERYQRILDDMNQSLTNGNYVKALDVWDDYDEDDRVDLINWIILSANEEHFQLEQLEDVEAKLTQSEAKYQILEAEYEQLQNTYAALVKTYVKINNKLEAAKSSLSTAITAVFLTAIGFYFLGRRNGRMEAQPEHA